MNVYKTLGFVRFARRNGISDHAVCEAVSRAERGLIDADLGGGVIKQRVPRTGEGRSGGFRTLILYRANERAVFAGGFAKNERASIDSEDLTRYRELGREFLSYSSKQVDALIKSGAWIQVECDG